MYSDRNACDASVFAGSHQGQNGPSKPDSECDMAKGKSDAPFSFVVGVRDHVTMD